MKRHHHAKGHGAAKGARRIRPEKAAALAEIVTRLQQAQYAFVLGYGGLTVAETAELRRLLKPLPGRMLVVKNTALDRAVTQLGWESVAPFLTGPVALVTGRGDAAEAAKLLVNFVKSHDKAAIKGACLDGKALGAADVGILTALPPRPVMLGLFVGTLAAPMSRLVGVFNQKVLSLLYVLKAVEEKKSKAA
jgi:large subunit ribosomal protein L10